MSFVCNARNKLIWNSALNPNFKSLFNVNDDVHTFKHKKTLLILKVGTSS